jgi:hypothetical protein
MDKWCADCGVQIGPCSPLKLRCAGCIKKRDREQHDRWKAANPETHRESVRKSRRKNIAQQRERHRQWRTKNPERWAAIQAKAQKQFEAKHGKRIRRGRYRNKKRREAKPTYCGELWMKANAMIPSGIRGDLRDDVRSNIILASLEHRIDMECVTRNEIRSLIALTRKQNHGRRTISIDAPMRSGLRWHDLLAA